MDQNIEIYIEYSNQLKKIIDQNVLEILWTKTLKSTLNPKIGSNTSFVVGYCKVNQKHMKKAKHSRPS